MPARPFAEPIDKLTRSIENAVTGESFPTAVLPLSAADLRQLRAADWAFNWKKEAPLAGRQLFKLTTQANPMVIHGLISLEEKAGHIFMHLLESAAFNKGRRKQYQGVAGNLVAYVCRRSFERGDAGYVAFDSKTALIPHYQATLSATHFGGLRMFIETLAARKLVSRYYPGFFDSQPL